MGPYFFRIRKLEESLANQIAAGEVVERPAAALKELMENSLDARAKEIRVSLKGGGVELLEVADDGSGIHPEDMALALSRHATSKIRATEDLFAIRSWGFRGEALASIAAVSRLKLSSRHKDAAIGRGLLCEGSSILDENEEARPVGTSVRVEELFFNTPARLKFLKSQAAETSACLQVFYRLALSQPETGFFLQQDGKPTLQFPAAGERERTAQVFREAFRVDIDPSELISFGKNKPDAGVRGYLLPMKYNIPSSRGIFTFVNGRSVKDKLLQQAVLAAAKEVLFGADYPQLVLHLDTKPEDVDVNVHPTKAELRFKNSSQIFGLVRSTIEETLANLRSLTTAGTISSDAPSFFSSPKASEPAHTAPENLGLPFSSGTHFHQKASPYTDLIMATEPGQASMPAAVRSGGPQFLGTLKNTYLVCQEDSGLLLVDQHAAHERITYEKLKKSRLEALQSAPLLIPLIVEIPERALDLLEPELERLAHLGLQLDRTGPSQLTVREIPQLLLGRDNSPRISLGNLVRKLLSHLEEEKAAEELPSIVMESMLETLASQSCHGSVRAGRSLSPEEVESLLAQMSETDFSGHCPHGRPTTVRLSWGELERLFQRKV